jgi:ATP-dependent RNA helicase SUPV3L1/SUV3
MLKPASAELSVTLWALKYGAAQGLGSASVPELPRAGLTSLPVDASVPETFYRVAGFHVCGPRAVRIDMLERLSDLIRPLVAWRPDPANPVMPPKGATGDGGFRATSDMMSILGSRAEELGHVLKALGFRSDRRLLAPVTPEAAATEPAEATVPPANGALPTPKAAPASVEPAIAGADGNPSAPEAAMPSAEPAPAPEATEQGAVERPAEPASGPVPAPPAEKWEEIWRPRRRGRAFEPEGDQRPAAAREPEQEVRRPKPKAGRRSPGKGPPPHRREQRREGPKQRREEGRRLQFQSSPAAAKGAVDPDSPFAALSSLKAAMEKRSQD